MAANDDSKGGLQMYKMCSMQCWLSQIFKKPLPANKLLRWNNAFNKVSQGNVNKENWGGNLLHRASVRVRDPFYFLAACPGMVPSTCISLSKR